MLSKRLTLICNYLLVYLFIYEMWTQIAENHRLAKRVTRQRCIYQTVPRPLYDTIGESGLNSLYTSLPEVVCPLTIPLVHN